MTKECLLIGSMVLFTAVTASAALTGATYEVPAPQALSAVATFPLGDLEWVVENGLQVLRYTLPGDLEGTDNQRIVMTETTRDQFFVSLSGPLSDARCSVQTTEVLCLVRYGAVALFAPDPAAQLQATRSYLDGKYAGSPDLPLRQSLAGLFHNEPAGLVRGELLAP